MTNETKVIDFFTGQPYTKQKFERHPTSGVVLGQRIIDEIVKLNVNPLVIDAGCGINPFKDMFDNIIGFDAAHTLKQIFKQPSIKHITYSIENLLMLLWH